MVVKLNSLSELLVTRRTEVSELAVNIMQSLSTIVCPDGLHATSFKSQTPGAEVGPGVVFCLQVMAMKVKPVLLN